PPESVSVFHVYFPDPWPKRRHRKRRLINAGFLLMLHQKLKSGGLVEVATDDGDYFSEINKAVSQTGIHWSGVRQGVNQRLADVAFRTNYELKYGNAGKTLYYLELKK
ncbi:MAG: hypothetical protein NC930_05280, partial [Candidatus Omnitrophica bacterium]|nr:hypothetical protein [Candidatus Omnitrophota bacterium]